MNDPGEPPLRCTGLRWALVGLGLFCVGLGLVGVFVPLMPTTIFLTVALWAFSRSSPRFHRWLYDHPRLGPTLRNWHRYRVIPAPAKAAALAMMTGGLVGAAALSSLADWMIAGAAALLLPVAGFILAQPSLPPSGGSEAE